MRCCAGVLRGALAVAACVLALTSCSADELLTEPRCDDADTLLLTAQSVPSAAFVPCFDDLPVGWTTAEVAIEDAGTTITFDSDRAGRSGATLIYAQGCDLEGTTERSATRAGTRRFVAISSDGRHQWTALTFDGGCITWEIATGNQNARAATRALMTRLQLIERPALDEIGGASPGAATSRDAHA